MSVVQFDSNTRQPSRQEQATATQQAKRESVLAKALGVTVQKVRAHGARLYYHADAIIAIERAFRKSRKAGQAAILAALLEYHDLGYETGHGDGQMIAARQVRR